MRAPSLRLLAAPALSLALLAGACERSPSASPDADALLTRDVGPGTSQETLLKAVRSVTARMNSTTYAVAAGYVPNEHCVAHPTLGGMGYHWANPTRVDATFDPLRPEAVLYVDGPNGQRRLAAVEYIIVDVGQPRPSFGGQLMDVGGTPLPVAHWSLHVWLYEENPNGLFTPFNPRVSCP